LRDEPGIVLVDNDICIGCKECIEACPFGAMQFNEDTELAVKCDLCYEKIQNNEAPACALACPTRCIFSEDMKTLPKEIEERVTQERN